MKVIHALLALVIVLSVAGCARPLPGGAATERVMVAEAQPRPRTISVSGEAEVRVVPDEVVITLGVQTWNKDLGIAKAENDEIVRKVLGQARDHGVEARHVQTDYMSVDPRYRDSYERRDFLGYYVRKSIVVTVKDLSRFEELLAAVLESGVTSLHGVSFRTTELRQHRDRARALAIQAAHEKASAMAGELRQKVGEPLTIREDQSNWYYWGRSWWGSTGANVTQNVVQTAGEGTFDGDSTIAPGQIAVNARVTVEFRLE